ncbi:hypothetical protein, partial [Burkholderia stagnalis]|uniref:hypothetical protein n=1 Tax=Burkholderia stagnalis TaxID=1503054 RepID=UPI001E5C3015
MNTVSQFVNNFFNYFVATAGFIFLRWPAPCRHPTNSASPFRAALPLARKRRDSRHPAPPAQGGARNKFKKTRALPRTGLLIVNGLGQGGRATFDIAARQRCLNTGFRFSTNAAIPSF